MGGSQEDMLQGRGLYSSVDSVSSSLGAPLTVLFLPLSLFLCAHVWYSSVASVPLSPSLPPPPPPFFKLFSVCFPFFWVLLSVDFVTESLGLLCE